MEVYVYIYIYLKLKQERLKLHIHTYTHITNLKKLLNKISRNYLYILRTSEGNQILRQYF